MIKAIPLVILRGPNDPVDSDGTDHLLIDDLQVVNYVTLTAGNWNYLSHTIPSTFSGNAKQVAIQFYESPKNSNTTVYVDAVSW